MLSTDITKSVVVGYEFKVVVDEENAVQFSRSNVLSLVVGNQSSSAKHTLHWNRRSALSKKNFSDHDECLERTLVLFPEYQWLSQYTVGLSSKSINGIRNDR